MSAPGVWRAPQQPAAARERLLSEIVARVPIERIAEIHLFPPMRQGGVEMGVAVIAAELDEVLQAIPAASDADEAQRPADDRAEAAACDPTDAAAGPPPESNDGADDPDARDPIIATGADRPPEPAATRYTVLTARYRLTLKGPDRGRWEADVTVEADAPLLTVDAVVRGVQRRAGDGVAPERLDAAALAAALGPVRFATPAAGVPTP